MAKSWMVLVAAVSLLIATGCSSTRPAAPAPQPAPPPAPVPSNPPVTAPGTVAALDTLDETLAGVYLGEAADKVKSELGTPQQRRPGGRGLENWAYEPGLIVYMANGTNVFGIRVEKNWAGQTPRGLKLGDSEERLRQLYGEPNYHGKNVLIVSKYAYLNEKSRLAISFDVNSGRVTGIQAIRVPENAAL